MLTVIKMIKIIYNLSMKLVMQALINREIIKIVIDNNNEKNQIDDKLI